MTGRKSIKHKVKSPRRVRRGVFLSFSPSYRRRLRNLGLALLVVFSTIFILSVFVVLRRLSYTLASASAGISQNEGPSFDKRFNILLGRVEDFNNPTSAFKDLFFFTAELPLRKVSILKIPLDLESQNLGGFGRNRLSSLYGLANLAKERDLNFISREIQNLFNVPVDGFLLTDSSGYDRLSQRFGDDLALGHLKSGDYLFFLGKINQIPNLFSSVKTNLSPLSLLSLLNKMVGNRFNKFEVIELSSRSIDDRLSAVFSDSQIEKEAKKIIVLNGTETPLMAGSVAGLIANLGGTVISTMNAPGDSYAKSVILVRDRNSYTLKRLAEVLKITDVRSFESFEDDPDFSQFLRADLVVILGLDRALFR